MKKTSTLRKTFSSIFSIILVIVLLGLGVSIFTNKKPSSEPNVVLGVDGIGGSSTTLVRTDDAVSLSYEINDGIVSSDFDKVYPYSHISRYVDKNENVFVYIPKFYSKLSKNEDGTVKLQISKDCLDGFSTLFVDGNGSEIDYVLVGAYESSGDVNQLYSKPGIKPTCYLTLEESRNASRSNGTNYQQYDYLTMLIVNQLFTVEFAELNSQLIFEGFVQGSDVTTTGNTDVLDCHTGKVDSGEFKYRGIENLYGNVWTFVDGVLFDKDNVYFSCEPSTYVSSLPANKYSLVSVKRSIGGGNYKSFELFTESSSMFLPSYSSVSDDSVSFGDWNVHSKDVNGEVVYGEILAFGGTYNYGSRSGIWCIYGDISATYGNEFYGSRLVYKPIGIFSKA